MRSPCRSDQRYDDEFLQRLRNEIAIARLIQDLRWPCKVRDGRFVFLCPRCQETESAVNPRTNLGRCFHCETNFNPIDFTISAWRCDFRTAVEHLTTLLLR